MFIKSLHLQNVGPHDNLNIEFGSGLTMFIGPNGSGKSTTVNSLYAGLTNNFNRFYGKKTDCIRQGTYRGEIEVNLADRHKTKIVRTFGEYNKVTLTSEGEDAITSDKLAAAWIERRFNITSELLDRYVFIPQGQLSGFLSYPQSEWQKMLAFLCRTDFIEEIWQQVGKFISVREAEIVGAGSFDLARIDKDIASAEESIAALTAELEQCESSLKSLPRDNLCQQALKARAEDESNQRTIANIEQLVPKAASNTVDLDRRLKTTSLELEQITKRVEESFQRYSEANQALFNAKEQQRIDAEVARLRTEEKMLRAEIPTLMASVNSVPSGDDMQAWSIERDKELLAQADIRRQLDICLASARKQMNDSCPTCGARKEHWQIPDESLLNSMLASSTAKVNALGATIRDGEAAKTKAAQAIKQIEMGSKRIEIINLECSRIQSTLQAPVDPAMLPTYQKTVEEYELLQSTQIKLTEEVRTLTHRKADAEKTLADNTALLDKLRTALVGHEQRAERAVKAQRVSEDRSALTTKKYATQQRLGDAGRNLDGLRKLRIDAERAKRIEPAKTWIDKLSRVRNVTHRSCVPKTVHALFLKRLLGGMNDQLRMFNAPFTVGLDDTLQFTATKRSGVYHPAKALSGGQQVMVALAFWLTLNREAGQLKLLVLDEPTDGLDKQNKQVVAEIFSALNDQTEIEQRQVIVTSHDELLIGACNRVYRFDAKV